MGAWDPQPKLEIRPEMLFLQVNFPNTVPLASEQLVVDGAVVTTPVSLETTQEFTAGGRLAIEAHFNEVLSFELTGFYMDGPDQSSQAGSIDAVKYLTADNGGYMTNLPDTDPITFPIVANQMVVDWKTETYGDDFTLYYHLIMLRGAASDVAVGLGGRFLRFRELTAVTAIDEVETPNLTGRLAARTDNRLAGPQLAARVRLQTPFSRLRAQAEGKIGLLANSFENAASVTDTNGDIPALGNWTGTQFSALFEGNFNVEWFVSNHITLYGGFQLLYADRVERASDQFQADASLFITDRRSTGSVFMFGPRGGILISF